MRTGKAYNIHKIYKMWYALSLKYRYAMGMRVLRGAAPVLFKEFQQERFQMRESDKFTNSPPAGIFPDTGGT